MNKMNSCLPFSVVIKSSCPFNCIIIFFHGDEQYLSFYMSSLILSKECPCYSHIKVISMIFLAIISQEYVSDIYLSCCTTLKKICIAFSCLHIWYVESFPTYVNITRTFMIMGHIKEL